MRLWWHKMKHWEYWSVYVIYLPTFFIWVWNMIRFRSLKFFKYSNPGITNGGLYGDSKMEIYKILPKDLSPKTVLIKSVNRSRAIEEFVFNGFEYPVIVKPDIGYRGIGVKMVKNNDELIAYANSIQQNFLIQELITLPNELGLFYYRIPTNKNGKISGITLKTFLVVVGNGKDTIDQLLRKNPRHEMQIPTLKNKINLNEILNINESRCLVPYGNHNRGTKFIDGKELITEKLERTFDSLLKTVSGFYYGRLDIRYNTFEELEDGKNFSIIELNGAKSEPTHIYDPRHSFWYGQREIFKHQKIFTEIVQVNAHQFR